MRPNNRIGKQKTSTSKFQQQQQRQPQQNYGGVLLSPQQQQQGFGRPSPMTANKPLFSPTPTEQLSFSSLSLSSPKSTHCTVIARPSRGMTATPEQANKAHTTSQSQHDSSLSSGGSTVRLIVYDLSEGIMSRISMPVLGVQIDALYHCNIEAFGVEYWYSSSGIQATPARSFTHIHGMQPIDNIVYDTTKLKISKNDFEAWLRSSSQHHFNGLNYSYFGENNGNDFAEAALNFLARHGPNQGHLFPQYIKDMPHIIASSPSSYGMVFQSLIEDVICQIKEASTTESTTESSNFDPSSPTHIPSPQDPRFHPRFHQYLTGLPTGVYSSQLSRSSMYPHPQRDEKSMNVYLSLTNVVHKSFHQLGSGLLYPFGRGESTTTTPTNNNNDDDNDNHNECEEIIFHAMYTYTKDIRPASPTQSSDIFSSPSPYPEPSACVYATPSPVFSAVPSPSPYAVPSSVFSAVPSPSPYAVPSSGLSTSEKSSFTTVQAIGPLSAERWKAVAATTAATTVMTPTVAAVAVTPFMSITPSTSTTATTITVPSPPPPTTTTTRTTRTTAITLPTAKKTSKAISIALPATTTAATTVAAAITATAPTTAKTIATIREVREGSTKATDSLDGIVATTSSGNPLSGRMI